MDKLRNGEMSHQSTILRNVEGTKMIHHNIQVMLFAIITPGTALAKQS